MNVKTERDRLSSLLRREIKGSYLTVKAPDHPLLLRGPDILIGGEGNLTAVYLPTTQEMRQDKALRSRYILSRLALPAATRHLLVHWGSSAETTSSTYGQFAIELAWDERRDIAKIAVDSNYFGRQIDIPKSIEVAAKERFSESYFAIQANRRLLARAGQSSPDASEGKLNVARLIDQGPIVDGVRENYFQGGTLSLPSIKSLIAKTTTDSFTLEDGVPLPNNEQLIHDLAAVADVASFQGDPDKVLRAAAFAGWALLEDLPQERQRVAAEHLRKLKKRRATK